MCGIAGVCWRSGTAAPSAAAREALRRGIAHRGPDGEGVFEAEGILLLHSRLAIIDVAGGAQPLHEGAASLVANGEIYNYRELKAELPGVRFVTGSDCEVPLNLPRETPATYEERLRGMYAIAVYDRAERTLTLSRDPFGIKPLYYVAGADWFAFASEPAALLAAGFAARRVRPGGRDELLQLQFTTGVETIFPGVFRVLPGETLRVGDGRVVARRRVSVLPPPDAAIEEAPALARLDRALMESVELHQRSDVPYGMFLSGGIDSAAVLACMARLNASPVLAYTAGFDVPGAADERAQAALVARAVGARHEAVEITRADVFAHLPAIAACMDDPAADYAILPSWFLGRRARADVKVVLSGEGGDEIFAGYGRYRRAMRPFLLGGRAMRASGAFDGLDVLRARPASWRDGLAAAERGIAGPSRSRLAQAQAADVAEWLPNDLLVKLDRCLMAHGVEGRTPLLDPGVAAAGFSLPDRLKVRDGRGKYLLRAWLAKALPQARAFAPKQGFTVPIAAWIGQEGRRLGQAVARQPGVAEAAHPERVVGLFERAERKREGKAAWHLLFYALWHRAHIEGVTPDASLYEVLK